MPIHLTSRSNLTARSNTVSLAHGISLKAATPAYSMIDEHDAVDAARRQDTPWCHLTLRYWVPWLTLAGVVLSIFGLVLLAHGAQVTFHACIVAWAQASNLFFSHFTRCAHRSCLSPRERSTEGGRRLCISAVTSTKWTISRLSS